MNKNMTALISCFSRSYHTKNNIVRIYTDEIADKILSEQEYDVIASNMAGGISFFYPGYSGDNPLEWIVNNQLAPSVLARAAFNEIHLNNEINLGLCQYVIMAAGYDTSGYKVSNKVKVFELDLPEMTADKINRIDAAGIDRSNVSYVACDFNESWIEELINSGFDTGSKTYCSLMGISYYLSKEAFAQTILALADKMPAGSCIAFDYPDVSINNKKEINKSLAKAADEVMKAEYAYEDIETIADSANMLIYEHLDDKELGSRYFDKYNILNKGYEVAYPEGICCCMLVKR